MDNACWERNMKPVLTQSRNQATASWVYRSHGMPFRMVASVTMARMSACTRKHAGHAHELFRQRHRGTSCTLHVMR